MRESSIRRVGSKVPKTLRPATSQSISFNNGKSSVSDYVPCLFLPALNSRSRQLILYFHANGEDLGSSYSMCDHLRTALELNVLAMEYPSYGVYKDDEGPSEDKILKDAELVYNFIMDVAKVDERSIFVMGRSLGSGPATHLAAKLNPGALLLMSPYTSIK